MKPCEVQVIDYVKGIRPYQSSVWRITIFFSVLVTFILGAFVFSMYRELILEQQHQVKLHLAFEKSRFQELASTLDKKTFAAQVRASHPKTMLVVWEDGAKIRGALSFIPSGMPDLPDTHEFPILTGGPEKLHIFTGGLVNTRYGKVLLANRTDQLEVLIDNFTSAALTAIMVTIGITLAFGFGFSKTLLRRIFQYNRLSEQIELGNYDTRLPIGRFRDEFDMLAEQFNKVLDTLENNLAAVRGVTDNIAHDLRTPLSHIRIGIEQLIQKPADEVPEACAVLLEELDNCLSTFNAMLSLARIEEGQQQLDLQSVSLVSLCQDLYEMAEVVAEMNSQTLRLSTEQDVEIVGDKYLLFTALYNLVDNAIKYSGDGAIIEIVQKGTEIQIRDTGPGISDEDKERVFERLVRLDPSRHHVGTGLGLSMVKAIFYRHHAKVTLKDNHPGLIVDVRFSSDKSLSSLPVN